MAYIVAVDPGKTTGWAVYYEGAFSSGEMEDHMLFADFFEGSLTMGPDFAKPTAIVCEDYIVTPETIKKSRQNYSLELIGILRWFSHQAEIPFKLQTPAQAKKFATDDKLKKLDWFKGGKGHADDASRHLLTYCVNSGIIQPEVFLA